MIHICLTLYPGFDRNGVMPSCDDVIHSSSNHNTERLNKQHMDSAPGSEPKAMRMPFHLPVSLRRFIGVLTAL